jgi:hypothetical protein
MSWHPFKKGVEYSVDEIVSVLKRDIERERVHDVKGKYPLIELFAAQRGGRAVFTPFGGAWGISPYNPNAWLRPDGQDLIPGYRQPRRRKPFTAKVRAEILKKTAGHCYSCGYLFASESEVWIEHIIPFSVGGSNELENLLPGCRICNYTRRDFTPHQIQRILCIGAALMREVDKESPIGNSVLAFLQSEEVRRSANRKHKDYGFLVFKREK